MGFMPRIKPQVDLYINLRGIPAQVYFSEDLAMKPELGEYIKARKKVLKITQDWIAEQIGVSSNAVSKWVKTGKISRDHFFALVDLIGKEGAPYLDGFIEGESRRVEEPKAISPAPESPPKSDSYQIDTIMAMLKRASPEQLESALDAVREVMRVKDKRIEQNGEERRFA